MGTSMVQRSSGWQVEKESVAQGEDVEMGDHHTGSGRESGFPSKCT